MSIGAWAGDGMFPTEPLYRERLQRRCKVQNCDPCEALAEAWAWRCADTMPNSAQAVADSKADAETLRAAMRETGFSVLGHTSAGIGQAIRSGRLNVAARRAETWASVAFRAVPGLRGQP